MSHYKLEWDGQNTTDGNARNCCGGDPRYFKNRNKMMSEFLVP